MGDLKGQDEETVSLYPSMAWRGVREVTQEDTGKNKKKLSANDTGRQTKEPVKYVFEGEFPIGGL